MRGLCRRIDKRASEKIIPIILQGVDEEIRSNAFPAIEEVLSNLKRYDFGHSVTIHWLVAKSGFYVSVQSESFLINFEILSQILEEAKCRLKNGVPTEFVSGAEQRHIGHCFIAGLPNEVSYTPDGRLIMFFRQNHLPTFARLQTVIPT